MRTLRRFVIFGKAFVSMPELLLGPIKRYEIQTRTCLERHCSILVMRRGIYLQRSHSPSKANVNNDACQDISTAKRVSNIFVLVISMIPGINFFVNTAHIPEVKIQLSEKELTRNA